MNLYRSRERLCFMLNLISQVLMLCGFNVASLAFYNDNQFGVGVALIMTSLLLGMSSEYVIKLLSSRT